MIPSLRADATTLDAFARQRAERAIVALGPGVLVMGAILALEYRLLLLGFVALAPGLIAGIEALRARAARERGFVSIGPRDGGVELADGAGLVVVPPASLTVRVTPRFAFVVHQGPGRAFQQWTIPGDAAALAALGAALRQQGATVFSERDTLEAVVAALGGVVAVLVLRVVASALVLGALAQIGLTLFDRGGSFALGALMLVGAVVALVVAALARRLVGG